MIQVGLPQTKTNYCFEGHLTPFQRFMISISIPFSLTFRYHSISTQFKKIDVILLLHDFLNQIRYCYFPIVIMHYLEYPLPLHSYQWLLPWIARPIISHPPLLINLMYLFLYHLAKFLHNHFTVQLIFLGTSPLILNLSVYHEFQILIMFFGHLSWFLWVDQRIHHDRSQINLMLWSLDCQACSINLFT